MGRRRCPIGARLVNTAPASAHHSELPVMPRSRLIQREHSLQGVCEYRRSQPAAGMKDEDSAHRALHLLFRRAGGAGAIHPNRDGINRTDRQDEF